MTIFILKILAAIAAYTFVSCVSGAIICYFITFEKRKSANHFPPLPEGSILGNHSERVS